MGGKSLAHPKLSSVRERFEYSCGYCGVSEIDSGGELTIDHFVPVSAGGSDNEENLVYACFRCNVYKTDFSPTEAHIAAEQRVLHPLRDPLDSHYSLDTDTGELAALTPTGTFHISLLQLNRPQLKSLRLRNLSAQKYLEYVGNLERENLWLQVKVQAEENYRDRLREESLGEGEI